MLLDHMVGDVKRLQREIGNADREKLDHYLGAFESLRDRRRQLSGLEATIRQHAPLVTDKYTSEVETDRIAAHFDIAAASLISGISNVVTMRADTLDVTYRGLGISKHVHGLGHSETVAGMTPVEARRRIRASRRLEPGVKECRLPITRRPSVVVARRAKRVAQHETY